MTAALPVGAPVQEGTIAEVGEFVIVHYGIDVHLAKILQVDLAKKEYRVIFFKAFGKGQCYTFKYEQGKATCWIKQERIYKMLRKPPLSRRRYCLSVYDLKRYLCIRSDFNLGGM